MRTIKFRFWNETEKTYHDYRDYFISQNGDAVVQNGYTMATLTEPPIVEQFTGLTDTNGKEIYEGDIVRVSPKFEPDIEDIYTGEVFFAIGYGAYMIDFHDYDLNHVLLVPTVVDKRVEVIGNIHENEELLNEITK